VGFHLPPIRLNEIHLLGGRLPSLSPHSIGTRLCRL